MNMHTPTTEMMQMWFTAQELADAAAAGLLVGLPTTKRNINEMADREGWSRYHALIRTERGRGGTICRYHIDLLPIHVRLAYYTRYIKCAPIDCARPLPSGENLSERARLERDARLAIVRMADRFHAVSGLTVVSADGCFADVYNAGRVEVPDWVRSTVGKISIRTLGRWRAKDKSDCDALAHDPSLSRKGTGLLDTACNGAIKAFVQAWVLKNSALSAQAIRGYCELEFGAEIADANGQLKPLPPVRTFQHFIKTFKEVDKAAILKATNPDKYRSSGKLVGTGSYSWITEPNQLWMIDASPADVLLKDGRHSIYKCIDLATRRCVITISKTPSAVGVGLMLRKAILKWGVAKSIKTDNGSDFVARAIQQLFVSLNIKPDVSQAYSPTEKAHVERAIKTFQHEVCPQLPGYIGHNVADRKAIEERKSFAQRLGATDEVLFEVSLTATELQVKIDDWLEHVYHHREHGGLDGVTPATAAQSSSTVESRVDERALDMLLMPVAGGDGYRQMTHQGIKIDHNYYMTGLVLVGTRVFVRLDPQDMGTVYVYTADGKQFIDTAVCPKLLNVDRPALVRAKKQQYEEMVSDRLKDAKAEYRRLSRGPAGIDRTIELAKRKTAEREATSANVIRLPKREEPHLTPQILAALDAKTLPQKSIEPKPLNDVAAKLHEAIVREAEEKKSAKVVHLDPDAHLSEAARRFKWARSIDDLIRNQSPIDDETLLKHARYRATAEYQTGMDLFKDFGLESTLRII